MTGQSGTREWVQWSTRGLLALAMAAVLVVPASQAQSSAGQNPAQQPSNTQPAPDIPDAPSTVQPPPAKVAPPPDVPQNESGQSSSQKPAQETPAQEKPAPPPMPPVETISPGTKVESGPQQGTGPKNQLNPSEGLYTIRTPVNFVLLPVMVKDKDGRRVDGLLSKDFEVLENGKKQTLRFFTSDPFLLSVAVVLDVGMADVAFQKVNQTYSALVGAFSPYDEFALYTYSSTVTRVTDFTGRPERLTAALDAMKLVRGGSYGPPVMGGPLSNQGPIINGIPVGTQGPPPVMTPPKESHVLNDAILRAALDLSKRDRTRRKVIFVISDGRERGSQASYKDVLKLLETYGIQVKAVVLDQGALPGYKQVEKLPHIFRQGYANILPRYCNATGGGDVFSELSRNSIEQAYAQITSEARNQYTLGYTPQAVAGSSAYRNVEVLVNKRGLYIYTKAGYYPVPTAR
jgi:VWFA-related protein